MAAAIIAAALVLGIVVVGVAIRFDADTLPTGPPLPPPAPTPVGLQLNSATREASYLDVKVDLAGPPYLCADRPEPFGPFEQAAPCSFSVHQAYNGSDSWQADTGLALVPAGLAVAGHTEATAKAVLRRLVETGYPAGRTTVSKLRAEPVPTLGDATVVSARLNLDVPKLATTYDAAVVVVVTAKDGQQLAFYSLKPNDAGDTALAALKTSANSLTTTG